jgi:hypothetical protein
MLESSYGNSELARTANNHFGIKCHSSWTGKKVYHDDDAKGECFRKYRSVLHSYQDHSDFLTQGSRYAFLFDLKPTDYKGWAKGLKKAGYATDPNYPKRLIDLIERYDLHEFDKMDPKDVGKPDNKGSEPRDTESTSMARVGLSANNIEFVKAQSGESNREIADRLEMGAWQIRMYNDVPRDHQWSSGDVVYLQPKRYKNKEGKDGHLVRTGETLWSISQKVGVKLRALRRRNNLDKGAEVQPGQELRIN